MKPLRFALAVLLGIALCSMTLRVPAQVATPSEEQAVRQRADALAKQAWEAMGKEQNAAAEKFFLESEPLYDAAVKHAEARSDFFAARDHEMRCAAHFRDAGNQFGYRGHAAQAERARLRAEVHFKQCIVWAEKNKNSALIGASYNNLGMLYCGDYWNKPEKSAQAYRESVRFYLAASNNDFANIKIDRSLCLGFAYGGFQGSLEAIGEKGAGLEAGEQSIHFFQEFHRNNPGNDKNQLKLSLARVGQSYYFSNQFQKTLDHLEEYLRLEVNPTPISIAQCAFSCAQLGRYGDSLRYADHASQAFATMPQPEKDDRLYTLLLLKVAVYINLAQYADALETLQVAHKYNTETSDIVNRAEEAFFRCTVYASMRDFEQAKKALSKVQEYSRLPQLEAKHRREYSVRTQILQAFLHVGSSRGGKEQFPPLSKLHNSMGIEMGTLCFAANLYQLKRTADCLKVLDDHSAYFPASGNPHRAAIFQRLRGDCLMRLKKPEQALAAYRVAVSLSAELGRKVERIEAVGMMQASMARPDNSYARALAATQQADAALTAVEKGRAQGLLRQMFQNRNVQPATVAASLDEQPVDKLSQSRQDLAQAHPDTLYIEFAVVEDGAWGENSEETLVFAFGGKRPMQAFVLPIGRQKLESWVQKWRKVSDKHIESIHAEKEQPKTPKAVEALLNKKQTLRVQCEQADRQEPQIAAELYRLLFGKLEKAGWMNPKQWEHLVIVADGPLHNLPFAVLIPDAKTGKRLFEDWAMSNAVSLDSLTWQTKRKAATTPLLAAADPTNTKPYRGRSFGLMGSHFDALPKMQAATRKLAGSIPDAISLIGPDAAKSKVVPQMPTAKHLLFATHGQLRSYNGLTSFLLLGTSADDQKGRLEARDVATMRLCAETAALWACQSGQGQFGGGDGLIGLAWAFQAAGCRSVIASSWEVQEEATAQIMEKFYAELRAGKAKDVALRAAMLAVRDQFHKKSPFYWAAFQVFGDTAPTTFSR